MTEKIVRHCVVCGRKIPNNLPVSELIRYGAATQNEDGSWIFHCIARHSREQIVAAAVKPPLFRRASEGERE